MKHILTFLAIIFLTTNGKSQEESFTSTTQKILRMGGAGGFTPYVLFWDVQKINDAIKTDVGPSLKDQPIFLYGGEGYGYIMIIENLRLGGLGAGGSTKTSKVFGNTKLDLETKVNFGGVTINYVIPISQRIDISIGSMIGWGGLDFKIRRDNLGIKKWDSLFDQWGNSGIVQVSNFSYNLTSSFFVIQPNVKFEYAILRWLGIRFGVGYLGMFGSRWKLDDEFEIVGVPENLNPNGLIIDTGLFIGTFLF